MVEYGVGNFVPDLKHSSEFLDKAKTVDFQVPDCPGHRPELNEVSKREIKRIPSNPHLLHEACIFEEEYSNQNP